MSVLSYLACVFLPDEPPHMPGYDGLSKPMYSFRYKEIVGKGATSNETKEIPMDGCWGVRATQDMRKVWGVSMRQVDQFAYSYKRHY